jgi:shikimate dehydrogenase
LPDAETILVGVIGAPVRHSLSPLLHNTAFAALDLNWVSMAFEVRPGLVALALDGMQAFGITGLSVTMPHKAEVASLVDECSDVARRLGAVNCIVNEGGTLIGENTDGAGFVASLVHGARFDPFGKRCLVVGAGGAARAVVLALAEAGALEVAVLNRTAYRAEAAATLAGGVGRVVQLGDDAEVAQADLVVNATPVGMEGTASAHEHWLIPPTLLHQGQVVADLIYAPRPTPWLAAAAAAGATTLDGLGMLVHQAAAQLERWTGVSPPVQAMWQAANGALAGP